MNKRNSLKLMVIAMSFFIFTTYSFAQDGSRELQKHGIGIGLGQTFLMGKFDDQGDDKITVDFFYTYVASYSFDLLIGAHFSHHESKDQSVDLQGYTMSIKGRYFEFDAFSPFVLGGLGFYRPTVDNGTNKSKAKYTFGFNAGAGVDLRLNDSFIVGLMGHFHKPFDVEQDNMTDVRGAYFKLLLTTMYLF